LIKRPTKLRGTGEGDTRFGEGRDKIKKKIIIIKTRDKREDITIDEKTTRDTNKSVTMSVLNDKHIHHRNTEGRHLGMVSSISTAREFKPV
jgi:hypothetical protein